jgi:hypothetical protein
MLHRPKRCSAPHQRWWLLIPGPWGPGFTSMIRNGTYVFATGIDIYHVHTIDRTNAHSMTHITCRHWTYRHQGRHPHNNNPWSRTRHTTIPYITVIHINELALSWPWKKWLVFINRSPHHAAQIALIKGGLWQQKVNIHTSTWKKYKAYRYFGPNASTGNEWIKHAIRTKSKNWKKDTSPGHMGLLKPRILSCIIVR